MHKRREFLTTAGVAALGTGAWLASAPAVVRAQAKIPPEPIKLGVIGFTAGVAALLGDAGFRATRILAEEINRHGGILGRQVKLLFEDEGGGAKKVVERFSKLTLAKKCDAVLGVISTGNGQAVGREAEKLQQLWMSWDGTTQRGLVETQKNPTYAFRSVDNEMEAIGGAIVAAQLFKDAETIAGINDDYSYGRNTFAAFVAIFKKLGNPKAKVVLELWPKLGTTDYSSHVAALKKANPDLIMTSFWGGHAPQLAKQGTAIDLWSGRKIAMITAGLNHSNMKKAFTPEGVIMGYNSLYFKWTNNWQLLNQYNKTLWAKHQAYATNSDAHAHFVLSAYKAAVERASAILDGAWPTKKQIAATLRNLQVPGLGGYRGYRSDQVMSSDFFVGVTTHDNAYDFVTIDPARVMTAAQTQKPSGADFYQWLESWEG
ncbi:MAG: ABC transporter substrate-binding protein [Candidatus Tectomicrobia bacterium]